MAAVVAASAPSAGSAPVGHRVPAQWTTLQGSQCSRCSAASLQGISVEQQQDVPSWEADETDASNQLPSSRGDEDLLFLTRLVNLMGVEVDGPLAQALECHFGARPREAEKAVKLLLRCFKMLHASGYSRSDVEVVGALASSYFETLAATMQSSGQPEMKLRELVHVVCVLMYIAHSYAEDETIPLRLWHRYLFREYCSLQILNAAVMGLLERLNYSLRVDAAELWDRLTFLREEISE